MGNKLLYISAILIAIAVIGIGWYISNVFLIKEKKQPIQLFFADNISPSHQLAIEEFNKLYKDKIEIVPVNLPFSKFSTNERKELLTRSLRSKSEKLDIFAVDLIWVPRFTKWCEPLDSYFSREEKQRLLPDAIASCIYDSALVAMPMYMDVGLMYYRRDILQKLPDAEIIEQRLSESISWDEFKSLRHRLGYEKKPYYIFPAKDYEGLLCHFFELAMGYDHNFIDSNTINLGSPAAHHALQMMVNYVQDGTTPRDVVDFDEFFSNTYMLDHDAVFLRSWLDLKQNFRTTYPDTMKLDVIAKAPLPHFQNKPSRSILGGWNFMISKSSTKKAAAIEFIKFYQSEHIQRMIFERMGYLPIINSLYSDTNFIQTHPEFDFYRGLLRRGFHRPVLVEYTRVSDIISHFVHLAIKREISVSEALSRADKMVQSKEVLIK
ncbi:MAG: extracellular solute-binding protein [Bacteroidetes bacterium]|nr:extracellular solute-binding protein [Bacteroidota bacterium]